MRQKSISKLAAFVLAISSYQVSAATYYVSPTGNDNSTSGSASAPYKTLAKAVTSASPGDIINVASGNYPSSTRLIISKNNITIRGQFTIASNRPVFDFSAMSTGSSNQGISLRSNGCVIYGIQIKGAGDNGMQVTGDNNTIEFCSFFENEDSGLQLDGGASSNKVINCDSYYNADPDNGDADGFACKLDVGQNNLFDGCRAWNNSDDGWDGYLRGADDINTTIKNSWAMKNGYLKNGAASTGNGSGFKMGGSNNDDLMHNQTLVNCFAFLNRRRAFHANNNKGSMTLLNCTAYGDAQGAPGQRLYMLPLTLASGKVQTIKNCVAFGKGAVTYTDLISATVQATNSWQEPFTSTIEDFVNLDFDQAYASRKNDGRLPDITTMHLASGSDFINKGTNVGLPFVGSKPDLGAFESSIITGFEEDGNVADYAALYPNPSNGVFRYKSGGESDAMVKIYNSMGILVIERQLEKGQLEHSFDLSAMEPGVYMVNISSSGANRNYPLIVSK
jgi:hypothetical protein